MGCRRLLAAAPDQAVKSTCWFTLWHIQCSTWKEKSSFSAPWMHVVSVDVQRRSLLTWAQDGRWAVDSSTGLFIPMNGRPIGSQSRSWYFGEEKNLFQDSNPGLPSPWSIRYTDYAVPAALLSIIPSSIIVQFVVQCSAHLRKDSQAHSLGKAGILSLQRTEQFRAWISAYYTLASTAQEFPAASFYSSGPVTYCISLWRALTHP